MLLRHRIHEWAADHFDRVQYPNIARQPARHRTEPVRMAFGTWLALLVVGLFGVALGLAVLGLLLFVVIPAFL